MNTAAAKVTATATEGRFAIKVDGEIVAYVFKDRMTTVREYAHSRLGRATQSASWAWESADGTMGNYDFKTRSAAVADAVA